MSCENKYLLSPNSLWLYDKCKRCFWLDQNEKLKRPSKIFPSLPSGIDKVLKIYFDSHAEKGELPPEMQDFGFEFFPDRELLDRWRNTWQGIRWTSPQGHTFRGAVDDIAVKDDSLVVVDYKTRGYPLKEDTADHYQEQLDAYAFLLEREGHEVFDEALLLFYYPEIVESKGVIRFNIEPVFRNVCPENAESRFNSAISLLEGELPAYDAGCGHCNYVAKRAHELEDQLQNA